MGEVHLVIKNAVVTDRGYGIKVNGVDLETIISTALGTKVGGLTCSSMGTPAFESNSCDVEVTIKPHDTTVYIYDGDDEYNSIEDLEESKREQFEQKATEKPTKK